MTIEGDDGYELWLRYRQVDNLDRLAQYRQAICSVTVLGESATAEIVRSELAQALPALLGHIVPFSMGEPRGHALVVGTVDELAAVGTAISQAQCDELGAEGFLIQSHRAGTSNWILVTGNARPAVLTGLFHFLRLLQAHRDIRELDIASRPRIRHRILGHWDNLNGSIERGYAGRSLWK
jgi:alpha-glucuronidase